MSSDTEREEQLRRLLSEAVDPVEPGPGAQTRLLARARAQAHRKSRGPVILRWGVPVALTSVVVIALVTLVFAVRSANRSDSSASTSAGSATSGKAPAEAAPASAAASSAGDASANGSSMNPAPPPVQLSEGKSASTTYGDSVPRATGGGALKAVLPADLDGDGAQDTIAVQGGNLVATLSRDGVQTVSLPPPVGAGAGVLGGTTLSDPSGKTVTVIFVRLTQAGTAATDTVVAVVNGRLTVLRQGSDPVLLTIDPTHGYGCDQRSLALAGDTTPFVVDGSQLVASPQLRGVITPAAKVVGCY